MESCLINSVSYFVYWFNTLFFCKWQFTKDRASLFFGCDWKCVLIMRGKMCLKVVFEFSKLLCFPFFMRIIYIETYKFYVYVLFTQFADNVYSIKLRWLNGSLKTTLYYISYIFYNVNIHFQNWSCFS